MRLHGLDHAQHHVLGLADRQAPDGVALEVEVHELPRALDPQALHRPALDDAEHRLPGLLPEGDAAALGPAQGQAHGALGLLVRAGQLHALVELHLDVGAEQPLDLDGALRGQRMGRAVDVGLERDAPSSIFLRAPATSPGSRRSR
jgi:hypothetical protein